MDTKTLFEVSIAHLFEQEGGYVNNPNDRGGETKYGISKQSHPSIDIPNLTHEGAKYIYLQDYWLPYCEKLPAPLAVALFDGVVQHGPDYAVRLLQKVLRVKADGIVGPVTGNAAEHSDIKRILTLYFAGRANFYHHIIKSDSSQGTFALGWFRRLFDLHGFIYTHFNPLLTNPLPTKET